MGFLSPSSWIAQSGVKCEQHIVCIRPQLKHQFIRGTQGNYSTIFQNARSTYTEHTEYGDKISRLRKARR